MVLSQQSIDALNLYGQLLLDMDIAFSIVLFITILQNKQKVPVCHDRFMKFVVEIPQSRIATATSRPPVRDIRDTVNPPRGFDQSAMLTSYRVWDYN